MINNTSRSSDQGRHSEDRRAYPGSDLGLAETGPGSLASYSQRVAALVVDWAACMIIATACFGTSVLTDHDWRAFATMGCYFVEKTVLTALLGGSFGQLLTKISVLRTDGYRLGWGRSFLRSALVCVVLPSIVFGANRRNLTDFTVGSVVVNRK